MRIAVMFSDNGIWADFGPEDYGYDLTKSAKAFADMVTDHLRAEWPDADISVGRGDKDVHFVDGKDKGLEADIVNDILQHVWESHNWETR